MKKNALEEIQQLVEYYKELSQKDIESFSEEDTKKDFILPLFHALGWQTNRRDVVVAEEQISKGFVDYSFRINGVTQFYLEAKPLKADLEDTRYAKQSINYAWLKNRTWAVLTDFEGLKVFNAQLDIKDPYYATVLDLKYDEFVEKFDKLLLLSPESFLNGDLDKYAEEIHKKKKGISVSEQLAEDLNEWRQELSKHIKQLNKLTDEEIDEGVQKILDRLIFIRTCEDRGIENESLLARYREWEDKGRKGNFQTTLKKLFEEYNHIYNSGLFAYHPVVEWETYSDSFEKIIKGLYGTEGDLIYDFKQIDADVLGSVYEQYLGFVQGKKEDKKDSKRKKQGIYYTPTYIVDYIVKNTLGELIKEGKDINDIKVLDPACGSGSFLIKVFEYLVGEVKNEDKTKEYESDKLKAIAKQYQIRNEQKELPKSKKINILRNNIYGVDLDKQAIEIAKLNLLLKATDQKEKLPYLTNLRVGNSLISGSEEDLKHYFGNDWPDKKSFDWNKEFEDVMKRGGFDIVVGNPPYISYYSKQSQSQDKTHLELNYYIDRYNFIEDKTKLGRFNILMFFIEKSIALLKPNGILGLIVDTNLHSNPSRDIRKYIVENTSIIKIIDQISVFENVASSQIILILKKAVPKIDHKILWQQLDGRVFSDLGTMEQQEIAQNKEYNFYFKKDDATKNIIKKIENQKTLEGIVGKDHIRTCITFTGRKDQFVIDNKKSKIDYPLLEGASALPEPYANLTYNHYVRYDTKLRDKLNKEYQQEATKSGKRSPMVIGLGSLSQFKSPKIFIRLSDTRITASYSDEPVCADLSLYILTLPNLKKENESLHLLYLLGVLNSSTVTFYAREANLIGNINTGTPQIRLKSIRSLPIPLANKKLRDTITQKSQSMLVLNKKLQRLSIESDEGQKIKNEIEKINKQIDEEVYRLYGLSDKEIKAVEGEK